MQQVAHPLYESIRMVRSPISVEDVPLTIRKPPPCLGEHTDEILRDVPGWSAAAIALLREAGVVAGTPA